MLLFLFYVAILLVWALTLRHLVVTSSLAKSRLNQGLWFVMVGLMPTFGVPAYWLIEGPKRRRLGPPPAPAS